MRNILMVIALACVFESKAQTDSTQVVNLEEVAVSADRQSETPEKTILMPSSADKKYTANAYDLIDRMNVPDLEIDVNGKGIKKMSGGEIVLMINGMEASEQEVNVLRSKEITSVEYVRHPTGKYAGKGGIVNFKTIQYQYGGNVYVSAEEGLSYKKGEYVVSADYTRKKDKISLIYSNSWSKDKGYSSKNEVYNFANGNQITKKSDADDIRSKNNDNYLNFQLQRSTDSYRYKMQLGGDISKTPYKSQKDVIEYSNAVGEQTLSGRNADGRNSSAWLAAEYTAWLKNDQVLELSSTVSVGKNKYSSIYSETNMNDILTKVNENNQSYNFAIQYDKTFKHGLDLNVLLQNDYSNYLDEYSESVNSEQKLKTNTSMLTTQISKNNDKFNGYLMLTLSNMYASINKTSNNYLNPMAFYGMTYAPNQKVSLSLNGYYTYSDFDPSEKNDVTLQSSRYEFTKGNPDLKPSRFLWNNIDINTHIKMTDVSFSYLSFVYFDNYFQWCYTDDNYMYNQVVNDGKYIGNSFSLAVSQRLFDENLRIKLKGMYDYCTLSGNLYHCFFDAFHCYFKIDYYLNKWHFGLFCHTPYEYYNIPSSSYKLVCLNYGCSASWSNDKWQIGIQTYNLFSKYQKIYSYKTYNCYYMRIDPYSMSDGREINIKVVYNLGYGKRTEREDLSHGRKTNSAILKSY